MATATATDATVRAAAPAHEPTQVLSRHPTSQGTVVYTRCSCGALEVWLESMQATQELIAATRHHPDASASTATGTLG
jgi:hypothetical protein